MQQKDIEKIYFTNSGKFCKPKSEMRRAQLKKQVHYKKKDVSFDNIIEFLIDKVFCFSTEEQELVKKELNANKKSTRREFSNIRKSF